MMADGVEFSLVGFDEISKNLKQVPTRIRAKGSRTALGKAAAVVRKAARANALKVDDPDTGRRIAQNVGQRVRTRFSRRTGDQMISVGVLTERGRIPKGNPDTGPRGNTPHWHLVEMGTQRARAQPFLRPALEANINAAINAYKAEIEKQIDRALGQ